MVRYVITAKIALSPVTYLFNDADRALAKVRSLQRQVLQFSISDQQGKPITIDELERERDRSP